MAHSTKIIKRLIPLLPGSEIKHLFGTMTLANIWGMVWLQPQIVDHKVCMLWFSHFSSKPGESQVKCLEKNRAQTKILSRPDHKSHFLTNCHMKDDFDFIYLKSSSPLEQRYQNPQFFSRHSTEWYGSHYSGKSLFFVAGYTLLSNILTTRHSHQLVRESRIKSLRNSAATFSHPTHSFTEESASELKI